MLKHSTRLLAVGSYEPLGLTGFCQSSTERNYIEIKVILTVCIYLPAALLLLALTICHSVLPTLYQHLKQSILKQTKHPININIIYLYLLGVYKYYIHIMYIC